MPVPMVGGVTVLQYLLNSTSRHLHVRLAKNTLAAEVETLVLADFVQCDFAGYSEIVDPVFSPIALSDEGLAEGVAGPLVWTGGAGVVAQPITALYGIIKETGKPDGLFFVQRVVPVVSMAYAGQQFAKMLRILCSNRVTG